MVVFCFVLFAFDQYFYLFFWFSFGFFIFFLTMLEIPWPFAIALWVLSVSLISCTHPEAHVLPGTLVSLPKMASCQHWMSTPILSMRILYQLQELTGGIFKPCNTDKKIMKFWLMVTSMDVYYIPALSEERRSVDFKSWI